MGSFNLADYIQPPAGSAKPAERKLQMIPTRKIFANDKNFYDTSKVDDLIDSILMQGLLDPLTVRPSGDGEGYIIISGHRRHRALMTILDDHLAEDTKPFETTPCFVREPGDELMEELMLIQANSATRVLTSAELSKQVDRVRDLLYGLKAQGYEFPGRMRDYVASACSISASKVARLDTIKSKLIPEIKQYYDDGRMHESVAYEIAKCSADDQRLIAKVKGHGKTGLCSIRGYEVEAILDGRDHIEGRKCKYACGVACNNMVKSLQKNASSLCADAIIPAVWTATILPPVISTARSPRTSTCRCAPKPRPRSSAGARTGSSATISARRTGRGCTTRSISADTARSSPQ